LALKVEDIKMSNRNVNKITTDEEYLEELDTFRYKGSVGYINGKVKYQN
jgi:hypothetical protein